MFRLHLAALAAAGLLLAIAVTAQATPNLDNLPPGSGMLDQPPAKVVKMLPPRVGLRPVPIRLPAGAIQPAATGVITKPLPKAKVHPSARSRPLRRRSQSLVRSCVSSAARVRRRRRSNCRSLGECQLGRCWETHTTRLREACDTRVMGNSRPPLRPAAFACGPSSRRVHWQRRLTHVPWLYREANGGREFAQCAVEPDLHALDLGGPAHREGHDDARKARVTVLERYQRAIYRYLLGAARDPDAADELFQDFAVRFVQGGFRRADPARGRFRDYLKTALIHLVSDYQRRQQKRPCPLDTALVQPETPPDEASDTGQQFDQTWREELLQRAWDVLKAAETEGGPPYYTALRFRAEHPQACSAETAAFLTEHLRLQPPPSEVAVRKALQRARATSPTP